MTEPFRIRAATADDLPDLGKMAAELVRYHHALDPQRFMLIDGIEQGYARFFSTRIAERDVVLIVAERRSTIAGPTSTSSALAGYAYAALEPRDWNALLDACGALHDIFVVPSERRSGVASALLSEVVTRLTALGAPRVVLSTATRNEGAHRLFERHGFRRTMIEMTRELG